MGGPEPAPLAAGPQRSERRADQPVVLNGRQNPGMPAMPPLPMPAEDVKAIAAYIHSVAATARGQGAPPPGPSRRAQHRGRRRRCRQGRLRAKCARCHSTTGDLAGIASRVAEPVELQNTVGRRRWRRPRRPRRRRRRRTDRREVTATVTLALRREGRRPPGPHRRVPGRARVARRHRPAASAASATCRRSRSPTRSTATRSWAGASPTRTCTT